ncbi:MAG: HAD family phosphatase [Candidatus Pacebacteria bacterium]|nr:HAD family phosphatase [Candidatus Paceibacterota bacterium]MDD2757559.1 HAD family phosphatase [Candidatus Paceibacterota bacterium]MDD3970180.1 HAD family phosphatase [Candidatus Paceibacterota bacterium]
MIKGIIFDMDGVLTDNKEQDFTAWKRVFADFGLDLNMDGYKSFTGMKGEEIVKKYIKLDADNKEATSLTRRKEEYFIEEIKKTKIEPMKGVVRLLNDLKKNNIKMGIGTAAMEFKAYAILEELGIKDFFEVLVSAEKVKKGKPDPETYLKVAEYLKIKTEECIVIEDAPNGIEAAKNGGIKCIAITSTHKESELQSADKIIDSFDELKLGELINL